MAIVGKASDLRTAFVDGLLEEKLYWRLALICVLSTGNEGHN